jgi:hypothetical protein
MRNWPLALTERALAAITLIAKEAKNQVSKNGLTMRKRPSIT